MFSTGKIGVSAAVAALAGLMLAGTPSAASAANMPRANTGANVPSTGANTPRATPSDADRDNTRNSGTMHDRDRDNLRSGDRDRDDLRGDGDRDDRGNYSRTNYSNGRNAAHHNYGRDRARYLHTLHDDRTRDRDRDNDRDHR